MATQLNFLDPTTWPVMYYSQTAGKCTDRQVPGVYAICGWTIDEYYDKKRPTVYYIGSSINIRQRLKCHEREGDLSYLYLVARFYYETDRFIPLEKELIKTLRPPLNKQHNG